MYGNMGHDRAKDARKTSREEDVRRSHYRKAAFPTRKKAEETARFWNLETPVRFTQLEPYRCRYCGHYHIGHMSQKNAVPGVVPGGVPGQNGPGSNPAAGSPGKGVSADR